MCERFLAACVDLMYSAEAPTPRFGSGAFSTLLRHLFFESTGRTLNLSMFGKPYSETYRYAERVLADMHGPHGSVPTTIYGVGDNPLTDIAGANAAGDHWSSVLVRTGIFAGGDNDASNPADIVADDIYGAVSRILKEKRL
jgi:ribonucleotide monophosphatase NagD (HAD superfamily)